MNGKILITGSKGYIGSHLINNLINKYEVVGFDIGDNLDSLIKGCKIVYHLASNVNMTERVVWSDIENDLHFSIDLLEKCVEYNVETIIYSSSGGTVYGPSRGPIVEQSPTTPICPYGMLKLTVENYIRYYCDLYNFNYIILRISNPYGGNTKKGIVHSILRAIKNDIPFTLWGDGSQIRDFIYIEDLIRAMVLVSQNNLQGVFNVGSGKGVSIKELIEIIQEIMKRDLRVIYKSRRFIDSLYNVLDNTKIVQAVNFSPQIDLIEGITQIVGANK